MGLPHVETHTMTLFLLFLISRGLGGAPVCPYESVTSPPWILSTASLIQLTCLIAWNTALCPVLGVPVANETLLLDANELIVSGSQVRSFHILHSQQLNCLFNLH